MNTEAKREASSSWPWQHSLDAVIAAREFHRVPFENKHVRVLEVRIKPGQIATVHTHRWLAAVYVLSTSDFNRFDKNGNLLFDNRTAGPPPGTPAAPWTGSWPPRSVENIGGADIHLITTAWKEQA